MNLKVCLFNTNHVEHSMEHIGSHTRAYTSSLHTDFVWDQPNVRLYAMCSSLIKQANKNTPEASPTHTASAFTPSCFCMIRYPTDLEVLSVSVDQNHLCVFVDQHFVSSLYVCMVQRPLVLRHPGTGLEMDAKSTARQGAPG